MHPGPDLNSMTAHDCLRIQALPGDYAPPAGRLALVRIGSEPAGCIALRPFDATRAEAKRLYVRPFFRGLGLGRALMEWVISEARAAGYSELIGDTMPVMTSALALYQSLGFESTAHYSGQESSGAIPIRLLLRSPAPSGPVDLKASAD